jgi:UDP-N-acetyl-D-glucosamine dehydrogenase
VGLTISAFASKHHEVVGFDLNSKIVSDLNKGISHIEGVDSKDIKDAIYAGNYKATANGADITGSDIVVIAVPTPLDGNRKPDLTYIDSACKVIAENLTGPALIINESTSYPGTLRDYIKPAIEKYSTPTIEHLYAISPERVDPGRSDFNQKNTPRLLAGLTHEATARTREFYSKFCDQLKVDCSNTVLFGLGGQSFSAYNRGGATNRLCFSKYLYDAKLPND